jgi:hypothetical protein
VSSSDIEQYQTDNDIDIFCINIFDTATQQLIQRGYAVVDEAARGNMARFGKYRALFIGTGG